MTALILATLSVVGTAVFAGGQWLIARNGERWAEAQQAKEAGR